MVDRVRAFDLTVGDAAKMYSRNLATWGHEAVAEGRLTEPDRAALLTRLRSRVGDPARGLFNWTHHQVMVRLTP